MYRRIDRAKINPAGVDRQVMGWEAERYMRNRSAFARLRRAYLENRITKQQLLTLRGQVKVGEVAAAMSGLDRLLWGGGRDGIR